MLIKFLNNLQSFLIEIRESSKKVWIEDLFEKNAVTNIQTLFAMHMTIQLKYKIRMSERKIVTVYNSGIVTEMQFFREFIIFLSLF